MAGDVFQLGNASYRIIRVERSTVRVEDARGQAPSIPFWLGEAPGRTDELSFAVSRLREELAARLGPVNGERRTADGLSADAVNGEWRTADGRNARSALAADRGPQTADLAHARDYLTHAIGLAD